MAPSVELVIVGGFLGSGKTTYINHLLQEFSVKKHVALIINEFGAVPIDGCLIEHEGYFLQEISGGCVCCTLKEKLIEGLKSIIDQHRPELVLIEATGLANPWEMKETIDKYVKYYNVVVKDVIIIVDPKQYKLYAGKLRVYDNQFIGPAKIWISKKDLYINDTTSQKICREVEISLAKLFGSSAIVNYCSKLPNFSHYPVGQDRTETMPTDDLIVSFCITSKDHSDLTAKKIQFFINACSSKIIRAKAIVSQAGFSEVIQFDGTRTTIEQVQLFSDIESRFVFFCRKNELTKLTQTFSDIVEEKLQLFY